MDRATSEEPGTYTIPNFRGYAPRQVPSVSLTESQSTAHEVTPPPETRPVPTSTVTPSLTTRSTYIPSTGFDPYALQELKYEARRDLVKDEMVGGWEKADSRFMDTFFPDNDKVAMCAEKLRDKYSGKINDPARPGVWNGFPVSEDPPSKVPNSRPLPSKAPPAPTPPSQALPSPTPPSQGVPPPPTPGAIPQPTARERKITSAFIPILNEVVAALGLSETRVAVDGQDFRITTRDGGTLKPDGFLWGAGSPAFPKINGRPETVARGKSQDGPLIDWPWCAAPIEIKTCKARGGPDNRNVFIQLGTYVREVFAAQTNRSFVPSLVLTESTIEFLLWDRMGVIHSERFDFHQKPRLFCRILVNLALWSDRELGFDTSIFYNPRNELCIRTYQNSLEYEDRCSAVVYTITEPLFRSYTLRGAASTTWRCLDEEKRPCIILDSWNECDPDTKYAFGPVFSLIEELEKERIGLGGKLAFVEDVRPKLNPGDVPKNIPVDSVRNNRRGFLPRDARDLVHTRFVWNYDGVLLEHFNNSEDLVSAFQGVVRRLTKMYIKKKMVHRDLTPWNILIPRQPAGKDSPRRSFFLDYSCAAKINSVSHEAEPRLQHTPGSVLFMSRRALRKRTTSYLDDLESVYWIFCFIITGHRGPDLGESRLTELPTHLKLWISKPDTSEMVKHGHIWGAFDLPIQEKFRDLEPIAIKMHMFFRRRESLAEECEEPPTPLQDFAEFLGTFSLEELKRSKRVSTKRGLPADEGELSSGSTETVRGKDVNKSSSSSNQRSAKRSRLQKSGDR